MGKSEAASELKAKEAWGPAGGAGRASAAQGRDLKGHPLSAQRSLQSQDSGPN